MAPYFDLKNPKAFQDHGKAKVKSSISEQEKKKKERETKVKVYRQLMSQLWDKRRKDEFDDNTLHLISEVLSRNPDIYTLWNFRRQILSLYLSSKSNEELSNVLKAELNLTESCIKINPKSYSAWHHRQWLMTEFPEKNLNKELELCTLFLKLDDRNFHCWDYRRWVASKLNVPDEKELEYTMNLINENFSNYSSWHYRSKLLPRVHPDPASIRPISEQMHLNELELVVNAAFTDPNDQSAWFYQRWLLGRTDPNPKPIRALFVQGEKRLYIAFSSPLSKSQITFNSEIVSSKWDQITPSLMAVQLMNHSGEELEQTEIDICVCNITHKFKFSFNPDNNTYTWSSNSGLEAPVVSSALASVLSDQLKMCDQLLEYEPDSKWTLLTSVYIMIILDRLSFKDEIMKRLKLLQDYDPLRVNYYTYLTSKYTIEYQLEEENNEFSFMSCNLKSLVHLQYLLLATSVNLSGNQLENDILSDLVVLKSCRKLMLDCNKLTSLENLPNLPFLESLTLSENNIQQFDDILPYLSRFPLLKTLNLSQNPVTNIDRPSLHSYQHIDIILNRLVGIKVEQVVYKKCK